MQEVALEGKCQSVLIEARMALRARICPSCELRPKVSELLGAAVARTCEPTCTLFSNLEALKSMAEQMVGTARPAYERAVRDLICQSCHATPTAGDYCYEGFTRACPLSVHAGQALAIIESCLARQDEVES